MSDAPDFSGVAEAYSQVRPTYPPELFSWLASAAPKRDAAWDTSCGSGQAAVGLAEHFDRVTATDISAAQISHAWKHPRVEYRVGSAEDSGLPEASMDLIVAAAAVHWFDLPRFYAEARRVAVPGAVLAVWTYHVAHMEPPFDGVFGPFYRDVVASYFGSGARLVDGKYAGIELPGSALPTPQFTSTVRWKLPEILRFLRTWSGVQAYIEKNGVDPVDAITPQLEEICGSAETVRELRWPLYLRASRIDS